MFDEHIPDFREIYTGSLDTPSQKELDQQKTELFDVFINRMSQYFSGELSNDGLVSEMKKLHDISGPVVMNGIESHEPRTASEMRMSIHTDRYEAIDSIFNEFENNETVFNSEEGFEYEFDNLSFGEEVFGIIHELRIFENQINEYKL